MSANESLQDALTVAQNNTPVPTNPGTGTNGSQAPVRSGNQTPVQGQPGIKDKTSAAPQQQQTQEQQMVPLDELKAERAKRQELEGYIRQGNQTVSELRQELAGLTGQLNGMRQSMQVQQPQQQQPQTQETPPAPDVMLEPDAWAVWATGVIKQDVMAAVNQMVMGIATDIFNQRMVWSDRDAKQKYGSDLVAQATTAAANAGKADEARQDFHPVEWCVHWFTQQSALKQIPTASNGQVDINGFRKQVIGEAFQDPNFWAAAVQQPNVQSALANAMRQPGQGEPQPQTQAPAPAPQPQVPVYQTPQGQPLPQSMANQPGAANTNVVPMPSANVSLQDALNANVNSRGGMRAG